MKKTIVILFLLFVLFVRPAGAVVNPLNTVNNIHGVHIIDENDLDDAARLVNSSGGEWGYITMVIREDERDVERWQNIFDRMRDLKLIPMIRIATTGASNGWKAPTKDEAGSWINFFDKLNWVIQNRYIILFNEPNHAQEWEGKIDPADYAEIAHHYRNVFKNSSDDYFILPAGFDQAAGNTSYTMDAASYFDQMAEFDPEIFTIFDGWTSHSYPNPNFSGSVTSSGKQSIRGYDWEISYLERFGLKSDIPVFITETGWAHREGVTDNKLYKSANEVAELYASAYQTAWNDQQIAMVSPFLLNYQDKPFDNFSWKKPGSQEYYPQYNKVLGLSKKSGTPVQITQATINVTNLVETLTTNSDFFLPVTIANSGQAAWNSTDIQISIYNDKNEILGFLPVPAIEPYDSVLLKIPISTSGSSGIVSFAFQVDRLSQSISPRIEKSIEVRDQKLNTELVKNRINAILKSLILRSAFAVED